MKRLVILTVLLALPGAVPVLAQSDRLRLPDAVQSLAFSGDLRLRNDVSRRRGAGLNDRGRLRYRLRLAAEALLPDDFAVVIRLGSGTGEQVSTNQSADNLSAQKPIWIDLAHLRWAPKPHEDVVVGISAGRILNPLWRAYSSDLVWDEDFNPEGAGESVEWRPPGGRWSVFANGLQGVADEDSNSGKNQWYFSQQIGLQRSFPRASRLRLAAAYHKWSDASRSSFGQVAVQDGNRRLSNGALAGSFGIGEVTGELKTEAMAVPLSFQATAVRNLLARTDPASLTGPISRDGYQFGLIAGRAKTKGAWEAAYFKKYVQTEAAVADVADSDFGDGGLNRAGHIAWVAYAPRDWMLLKLKGFVTDTLDRTFAPGDKAVNRLQMDLAVKF